MIDRIRIYYVMIMKRVVFVLFSLAVLCNNLSAGERSKDYMFIQWNIWQEGSVVEGGYEAIVDELVRLEPDFVAFSEVRNYDGVRFCDRIVESLDRRGLTYYSFYTVDSGLLSRYPIMESSTVFPENGDHGSIYRMVVSVSGRELAVYTAHLDYLNDAYYNVRGYDGSTWEKIPVPESVCEVLEVNDASQRDDAIKAFLEEAGKDLHKGRIVILGGDFNEPSHMDWIRETKDMYDHNGMIVPWTVTLLLDNAGFIDAYREMYPDVLNYPGFTFPSDNPDVPVDRLTWAPEADERERIDYIFYYPDKSFELEDISIFGPEGSICRSERIIETGKDIFVSPSGKWPTDHKGLIMKFRLGCDSEI